MASKKSKIESIVEGKKFISHIDNVSSRFRLSDLGIKKKGRPALSVIKNLHHPSGRPKIHIIKKDKYGKYDAYHLRDEKSGVVLKIQGSYLTIANPQFWTTYDLTRATYNRVLTAMVEALLSLDVIRFGNGKSPYHAAYHLLSTRATIHIEHAIDLIGIKTGDYARVDKNKNKWYQRNGFSRLEVNQSFRYPIIKHALKQRQSLPLIKSMGMDAIVKLHTRNIMDKMPPWAIKDVFNVEPGKDKAYTRKRLKAVLNEIIPNNYSAQ